jgi:tRNA A37 methylthiotransferase MiaB
MPIETTTLLKRIMENDLGKLKRKGQELHSIINGRITVLPPDTRHVDYDVIPIILADGCLYNCGFCAVKSGRGYQVRSRQDVFQQIKRLKKFYGADLPNYNSIFLGMHDALNVGRELIESTVETAFETFNIEHSEMIYPKLFLFGSVDSLLDSQEKVFETINKMPFYTFINIGMESTDQETLDILKKPLSESKVKMAFDRMLDINLKYDFIEITANFVIGSDLPSGHFSSIASLTAKERLESYNKDLIPAITSINTLKMIECYTKKGNIYLSPLIGDKSLKKLLKKFNELKKSSYLSMFMYLIQRL